jgi:regulatory protein
MAQKWRAGSADDKNVSTGRSKRRSERKSVPLTLEMLDQLALAYVARYATSGGKLRQYLRRKVNNALHTGTIDHDVAAGLVDRIGEIAARMTELGYVDDRAWATAQMGGMARRGLGAGRVREKLRQADIDSHLIEDLMASDDNRSDAENAALRFAQRHKIGPFGPSVTSPGDFQRAMAKMIRAGHPYDIANKIVRLRETDIDVSPSSMK